MISRREVVTAGVLGTLATATPAEAKVAELQQEVEVLKAGFKALEDKMTAMTRSIDEGLRGSSLNYGTIGTLRTIIEKYARASGKFPDYVDGGCSVFYDVYDWHVRHQQQINITRIAEQRLAIQFLFTQVVLRWELEPGYIGPPFDR